ncbi:HotDog domain-containing protein [Whalleya microplaca]|nr:HotDog domain-containing protein [Whalleya microplaca]
MAPINPPPPPHSPHNQAVADPLAHFKAIPWCAALLASRQNLHGTVAVPDCHPLPSGEASFVRKTLNNASTVRACVTFLRASPSSSSSATSSSASSSISTTPERGAEDTTAAGTGASGGRGSSILSSGGGGKAAGEDPRTPFLLFHALVDLGEDCNSYKGTLHGGLYAVLMDEVMGTAANFQTGEGGVEHGAYTVSFTTRFRRAIRTPQIVLVRGRVVRKEGRKIWVKGVIEDKDGNVMAEGDGLWLAMNHNIGHTKL